VLWIGFLLRPRLFFDLDAIYFFRVDDAMPTGRQLGGSHTFYVHAYDKLQHTRTVRL